MFPPLIYHEKQGNGRLCGLHALNVLLQGPFLSESDLSSIALRLDAEEKKLLEGTDLAAFTSSNVANDGYFSLQVLSEALSVWNIDVVSLRHPSQKNTAAVYPASQTAFLCHLHDHWFVIRRTTEEHWYEINSLRTAPKPLGVFHLDAYLSSLEHEGYSIFVILGFLPQPQFGEVSACGRWWTHDEAVAATKEAEAIQKRGAMTHMMNQIVDGHVIRSGPMGSGSAPLDSEADQLAWALAESRKDKVGATLGVDDDADATDLDLQRVLAASQLDYPPHQPSTIPSKGAHRDENQPPPTLVPPVKPRALTKNVFRESVTNAPSAASPASSSPATKVAKRDHSPHHEVDTGGALTLTPAAAADGETSTSTSASTSTSTGATEGGMTLVFRLPSGDRMTRCFTAKDTVSDLLAFLNVGHTVTLVTSFPRREVRLTTADGPQSTSGLGFSDREVVMVQTRPY